MVTLVGVRLRETTFRLEKSNILVIQTVGLRLLLARGFEDGSLRMVDPAAFFLHNLCSDFADENFFRFTMPSEETKVGCLSFLLHSD
jgi:hypothetical protein